MKIGILSFYPLYPLTERISYEERRLLQVGRERGHQVKILRTDRMSLVFDSEVPRVLYDGKPLSSYDVFIPRVSVLSNLELRTSVLRELESQGARLLNGYHSIVRAKNKLRTFQILNHHQIPIPKTVVIQHLKYLDQAISQVGGLPVIMKTPFGSYGSGVLIAESKRSIVSALDILWKTSTLNIVLIQQYIRESKGCDIRVFVVGDRVVASMMRQAKKGEFRSNIELGATGKPVEITSEEAEIAVRAARALDLQVAGIDLVRSKNGPLVLEVNSNPGFRELEKVSKIDVAGAIIDRAVFSRDPQLHPALYR